MKPRLLSVQCLSGPLIAAVLCQPALCALVNITWDGDTSTDWSNAANWTGNAVPANDITTNAAVFSAASPLNQPSIAGAVSVGGIDVQLAAGGFNLSGSGTLTLGDKGIDATTFASGTLTIGVANILMTSSTDSSWSLGVSANTNTQATTIDLTSNIQLHKTAQLQLNSPRGGTGGAGTFNVKGVISNTTGETTSGQVKYLGGSAAKNTFNVTGLNTYTGNTLISQAVVNVNSLANEGTASALGSAGTINIVENSSFGTLAYNGTQSASTNRRVTIGGSGASSTGQANIDNVATNAAHTLSFTGTASIIGGGTGNRTLGLRGTNTGNNSFAPLIENASGGVTTLRKEGVGKWAIANAANTYTGETVLIGGTLEAGVLADSGTPSSLGSGGVIRFNGGTLLYNGTGSSSNRTLEIGPSSGTGAVTAKIQANGSGALSLTASTMNYGTVNELRILSLGGTGTQDNTFATAITNNGTAATAVAKADAGRWILTNTNNTFSGGLNVSGGGRLGFSSDGALGTSSGAITFSGSSEMVATQGATIGSGRTITLSGSSTASFGITSASGTTLDVAAKITGTGAVNRVSGSSTATGAVRYSNAANDFTGDFNTRYGVVEVTSVANAGVASAIGAGSQVGIGNGNSAAVLRYVGAANSSTDRNLVWNGGTGPLALESGGAGVVQWLGSGALVGSGASSGARTLTLGGSNTGLNVLAQPINDTPAGGATSLVKSGAGTWRVTGTSSHSGTTTVESGKLLVDGDISSSALNVAIGAVLGGSGTIGTASIAGVHSPGNSPGVQTVNGSLSYQDGSSILWELIADATSGRGTSFDGIDVTGNLVFSGATALALDFASTGSGVDWSDSLWDNSISGVNGWKVFDLTSGAITGFANLSIGGSPWLDGNGATLAGIRPNASFSLFQDGNDIYLNYTNVSAIPEPGGALGLGVLLGAGLIQRRRRING